ncbi:MAG: SUMF1/EgtB/PvdO family nonheme iron enzyme [Myxococcales bacterium]|nr:SUMF1/EgtB/PvdO family nonheme iron enzyme [Myxococcales bacterium]
MKRRPLAAARTLLAASLFPLLAAACGGGTPNPILSDTTPTGVDEALGDMDCGKVKAQDAPDLMGWDPAARANLDRMRQQGMVAVRYSKNGCDVKLELLPNCKVRAGRGKRTYAWSPYSANETKIAHNQAELYAKLPLGAVGLSAKVGGERSLRTDYMLVGTRSVEVGKTINTDQLVESDDCSKATHVITTIYYGGFALASGANKEIEAEASVFGMGAGGSQKSSQELLANEGNADACKKAQASGEEQPTCNVPLRVNLAEIEGRQSMTSTSDVQSGGGDQPAAKFSGKCPTDMLPVAPGSFRFGPRKEPSTIDGLCIDTTEVTAGAFLKCVESGKCPPPKRSSKGCHFREAGKEDFPMNCVTLDEATQFCKAQGKRLPTDKEWEYAAVGHDGREFPWGDGDATGKACFDRRQEGACKVGSFPDGKSFFGAMDMGGNVAEWTSTADGDYRYLRGGDYSDSARKLASALHAERKRASMTDKTIGFRCAK